MKLSFRTRLHEALIGVDQGLGVIDANGQGHSIGLVVGERGNADPLGVVSVNDRAPLTYVPIAEMNGLPWQQQVNEVNLVQ